MTARLSVAGFQLVLGLALSANAEPWQATSAPSGRSETPANAKLNVAQAVERFLTASEVREAWFAPSFLAQVPFTQIESVRTRLTEQLGPFVRLDGAHSPFNALYKKGRLEVNAALDAEGRFVSLWLKPSAAAATSMASALAQFKELPGKVSVLVQDNATTLGAIDPDVPLAVASTFKLATLATLRAQIEAKKRTWRDVVELSARTRSLPSGFLQKWPADSPLTLFALAALMISQSDNTATDTLIDVLKRENIEPLAGRNQPYLMTREAFLLKSPNNQALLKRYREGDQHDRRALLEELKVLPLPDVA